MPRRMHPAIRSSPRARAHPMSSDGPYGFERRLQSGLPVRGDGVRRGALLALDALGHADRFLVAGTVGDTLQLLVGRDLEVLEGVAEARELGRGVRLRLEEPAQVERAEPHDSVLQLAGSRVVRVEPRLDDLLLRAGL